MRRALQASLCHISNPPYCESQIYSAFQRCLPHRSSLYLSLLPILTHSSPAFFNLHLLHQTSTHNCAACSLHLVLFAALNLKFVFVSSTPPSLCLPVFPALIQCVFVLWEASHYGGLTRMCAGPQLNIKVCKWKGNQESNSVCLQWFWVTINN